MVHLLHKLGKVDDALVMLEGVEIYAYQFRYQNTTQHLLAVTIFMVIAFKGFKPDVGA